MAVLFEIYLNNLIIPVPLFRNHNYAGNKPNNCAKYRYTDRIPRAETPALSDSATDRATAGRQGLVSSQAGRTKQGGPDHRPGGLAPPPLQRFQP